MATGSALPVINLPIEYPIERQNVRDFLRFFKGPVPALEASTNAIKDFDDDADVDADGEDDVELQAQLDGMGIAARGSRRAGVQTRNAKMPLKYMAQLQRICNRDQDCLVVDLKDVAAHRDTISDDSLAGLALRIANNTRTYANMFCDVIDELLAQMTPERDISHKDDVLDVIMHQRQERNARASQLDSVATETLDLNDSQQGDGDEQRRRPRPDELPFPPILLRRYNIYFKGQPRSPPLAVRSVRASHLGKLITVRGIVTRVSEVKPYLLVDAYSCDACGAEIFQEVAGRTYMPLTMCWSQTCTTNKTRGTLHQQTRASKFTPFQEVRVQEMADQVPVGHIPRSMTVHLYGPLTRHLNPGDVADIGGIFLPTPYTGFKAIRAGLLTDTYLDAQSVQKLKKQYDDMRCTPEIEARIEELKSDPALYAKLASSIAPEIYGHEDVKKCLLLLLVGGVTKSVGDGMKIRGDLNVCLMGDPGVAKSQLLKYISKVAPRGVYTTGRGSSGVGLTAAVMRDPVTDEMVLEGGALVLADNGIACIDEFDKMDESDRTAIHEVMEQQTISINKAGICTTLNARTSILAAANPLYGRYNPRISPVDNINLPAALLSRFDVLFLILDTPSRDDDERLAQHVAFVHMHSEHPPLEHEPLEPNLMRHYIALARQKRPTVPKAVSEYVVGAYVRLRAQGKEDEERSEAYTYTSARTLLGVLRLSQALARLRFASQVEVADVDEALRLMEVSKASLYADGRRKGGASDAEALGDQSKVSKIYRIIRDMALAAGQREREEQEEELRREQQQQQQRGRRGGRLPTTGRLGRGPDRQTGGEAMEVDSDGEDVGVGGGGDAASRARTAVHGAPGELLVRDVRDRVLASGWVEDELQECIQEYSDLGVLQVSGNRLYFL